MKIGVIADIHSNAAALKSVLGCLDDIDEFWCLGDIVGYGPEPAECVELVRSLNARCVIGNHDLCVLQDIDISVFNVEAIKACDWNRQHLSDEQLSFLKSFPVSLEPIPGVILVHGSPRKDVWEYVLASWQADEILAQTTAKIIFVGHSHVPLLFARPAGSSVEFTPLHDGQVVQLDKGEAVKYLINPGSIGQPRDGDPRASYMIFDTGSYTIEFHRVNYPIEVTQQEIKLAGLPASLADRLANGV